MKHHARFPQTRAKGTLNLLVGAAVALIGCASTPLPPPTSWTPRAPQPALIVSTAKAEAAPDAAPMPAPAPAKLASRASNAQAYRLDAAGHLYKKFPDRIYRGKLPPLLYAVGVFQVEVDREGQVTRTSWMRAPAHAPEVIAEIEKAVRAAAPFPVPAHLGRVTYTDTWLWHKSGQFQLDTLTEGQL